MAELIINTFPTGLTYSRNTKAPLESYKLFNTLALAQEYVNDKDKNAYVGLTISVIADETVENNGLYYISQIADETHNEGILVKVGSDSGSGSVAVNTFAEARELATTDNIGQVIYVTEETTEGSGESAVTYSAGPYIVTGDKTLSKLGTTSASGDLASDVSTLQGEVGTLKTTVGDEESGLVKDVADLKSAVEALPATIISDVKVDGASVVTEGVANISLTDYAKSADVASKDEFDALSEKVGTPVDGETAATGIYKLIEDVRSEMTSIPKFAIEVVDSLPESGNDATVYLVKDEKDTQDLYTEYIFVNNAWENLGKQSVDLSAYSTTAEMNTAISNALATYVTTESLNTYKTEVSGKFDEKANAADVYSKTDADSTFVKSADYVAYTQTEKDKLAAIADGAQVNVIEAVKVKVSDEEASPLTITDKAVTVDLTSYAKTSDVAVKSVTTSTSPVALTLTDGVLSITADVHSRQDVNNALAAKLDATATVNEKSFVEGAVIVDAADIKLNAAIEGKDENGDNVDIYTTDSTVQNVLSNLSARIDAINTIVDGQLDGVAAVSAGNGISVTGTATNPVVGIKVVENTGLSVTESGLSVKIASNSALAATENGLDIFWTELS